MPIRAGAEADVPRPIVNNLVKVARQHWNGRDCLAVELTDEEQRGRLAKTRTSNGPSYAIVHRSFSAGVIESDVGAELNGKGAADARGFVGFAFHLSDDLQTYEAVYLRMTNGRRNDPAPPPPRIDRAIQYVAHPDFHFAVSRANFPGRYEKGADIGAGRWHRLRLEVRGAQVRALVDGRTLERGPPDRTDLLQEPAQAAGAANPAAAGQGVRIIVILVIRITAPHRLSMFAVHRPGGMALL